MTRWTTIALGALLMAAPAAAHEGHKHTDATRGGTVVANGHHQLEVVAKDGTLEVFVTGEDGAPEETAGAKASAVILAKGKKTDVTLAPAESNVLRGSGDFTAGKGTTIVLTLTMPGHKPEQSRVKLD
jgi:hypothetical protein